jgi:hypothetical protein
LLLLLLLVRFTDRAHTFRFLPLLVVAAVEPPALPAISRDDEEFFPLLPLLFLLLDMMC